MATINPFNLLDDDAEDPAQLLAAEELKVVAPAQAKKAPAQAQTAAKLPSKPLPPSQAVRESRNDGQRGGRGGAGRGGFRGRGGRGGFNRDLPENENTFGNSNGFSNGYNRPSENGDSEKAPSERRSYGGPRGGGGFRAGRRGGFSNGEAVDGERPRRVFDRRSGTGRGGEVKREGAGRGNWGTSNDEIVQESEEAVNEVEKNVDDSEKQTGQDDVVVVDANKESDDAKDQAEKEKEAEKEAEEKEMTLEEYEKVREEKRKALLALKAEERKVNVDKELESMKPLSSKKNAEEIFAKLGSDKEDKRKDAAAEKAKKSVSINEFLKPAEGENYHRGGGGRGRGGRGRGGNSGYGGNNYNSSSNARAPAIEDVAQFPSLAAK